MNKENFVGKKFEYLTILEHLPDRKVLCKCDCGTVRSFNLRDIKRKRTKGCGCRRNTPELKELARKRACLLVKKGILNGGGDVHSKEYREFKYCFKNINRKERKECLIKIEDLKDIWEKQNGYCPYSNIKLVLPTHSNIRPDAPYKVASVDRIDSSKPYTKDNIQFVSRTINYAKNSMSHQDMCKFIDILRNGGGEGIR